MASRIEPGDDNIASALIAADASPEDPNAQEALGSAYLAHEMFQEAIGPFARAREIGPASAGLLFNLSTAQTMSGDGAGGEETARAAIALDSASADGYFCLGNALRRRGDPHGAIAAYVNCLQRNQEDWFRLHTRHNLGLALEETGRLREALQQQELVLAGRPNDMLAIIRAGVVLEKLGELEAAASMLRRACDLDPTSVEAWDRLGVCLLRLARHEESVHALRRLLELDSDSAKGNVNLAVAYLNLDRPADALPCAERAHELAPENEKAIGILKLARLRSSEMESGSS